MALLSCRGLSRRPWFEGRELQLAAGEIVFLRGPTGSGKTLLLRALADLDPVDAGEVFLDGRERGTYSPAEWRRNVLYVHQSAPRLPGSVAANLERIADLRIHRGRSSVPQIELSPELDADRLSGGQAQLLALRRALLVEPRVLLLDESTTALDEDSARAVEGELVAWVAGGRRALLWVSHSSELIGRLGTRQLSFS